MDRSKVGVSEINNQTCIYVSTIFMKKCYIFFGLLTFLYLT